MLWVSSAYLEVSMTTGKQPTRHKIVQASMRFDFVIPADMPKESADAYAQERFKKLCDKLNNIKGVSVEYTLG